MIGLADRSLVGVLRFECNNGPRRRNYLRLLAPDKRISYAVTSSCCCRVEVITSKV